MHRKLLPLSLLLLFAGGLAACGGSRMSTMTASQRLKPAQALPEREHRQLPVNLTITISNVADAKSSYQNFIRLFINGREIAPEQPENNVKATYRYNLRLQPGIYEVKAEYHAVGFWRERVYDIGTDEPVKILPDQRTDLSIALKKDSRGFLRDGRSNFAIAYTALDAAPPALTSRFPEDQSVARQEPEIINRQPVSPPATRRDGSRQVKLQINTMPIGADIYVDDRFVGQSPVRVIVDGSEGHVVQISRKGYQEHLKVIDVGELAGKADLQIIVRLEKIEAP